MTRALHEPAVYKAISEIGVNKNPKEGDLMVWWMPQVGLPADFKFAVKSPEEALLLLDVLAAYDGFQALHRIKGDYANTGGLFVFEDGEWLEWEHPETGEDIDAWRKSNSEMVERIRR
jgi:hypothetical protein